MRYGRGVKRTGGALTMAFVHTEDMEPPVDVDKQGTDGNDHDYVSLGLKEGGESGIIGYVPKRKWGFTGGSSLTPGAPPEEHTPINGTYVRVEGGAQGNQQYGGIGQNAIKVTLVNV